ncbi:MAG: hypothetical protein V4498_10510 [candidate division FCPU426 bacterium]
MRKAKRLCLALLVLAALPSIAFCRGRATAAKQAVDAAEKNAIDFSVVPFSDLGSHVALRHLPAGGFNAWELDDASARDSSAEPGSGRLLRFRVELQLERGKQPLFSEGGSTSGNAQYYSRWSTQEAKDSGVSADAGLAFAETDGIVFACNFVNRSRTPLRVRPALVISPVAGAAAALAKPHFDPKTGLFSLSLGPPGSQHLGLITSKGSSQMTSSGDALSLGPKAFQTLSPGQSLRFPVAFKVASSEKEALLPVKRLWTRWALPKGMALGKARLRAKLSRLRLPRPVDPRFESLVHSASVTLLTSQYAKRGSLQATLFSQAKAGADGFFSEGMPLIALGFSELDLGLAEAALLELSANSADQEAPLAARRGETLGAIESAGLPMHGWASMELYLRDPDPTRASVFLGGMGRRLRHESSWWPAHRDGDGNGLYAYAKEQEKPWAAGAGKATEVPTKAPKVQTYSVALSSFVAFQMQLAAALAEAAGDTVQSKRFLDGFQKTAKALKKEAWTAEAGYGPGLDGVLPYLLGLDTNPETARKAMDALLKPTGQGPAGLLAENGVLNPARAYLMLKALALFGYGEQARQAATRILDFLGTKPCFSAYDAASGKGLGAAGDAGTAAAILEMALERYTQDALWLPDSGKLSGGWLTLRSPDGGFYMKRTGLSSTKREAYSNFEAEAKADTLSLRSAAACSVSLVSKRPITLVEVKSNKALYSHTRRMDLSLKANTAYLIKLEND